jgi:hypothetical protein
MCFVRLNPRGERGYAELNLRLRSSNRWIVLQSIKCKFRLCDERFSLCITRSPAKEELNSCRCTRSEFAGRVSERREMNVPHQVPRLRLHLRSIQGPYNATALSSALTGDLRIDESE